jgi:surfeit locus 1 family protein
VISLGPTRHKFAQYNLIIRFENRRFSPSFVGAVLVIVGIAIFIQLGVWQLRRAEQKQALQSTYELGQQTTVTLTASNVETLQRYQHVRAAGRFAGAQQILLDNMPSAQGRPGFRVLTPFLLDGVRILVDRGWIPMGNRGTDIPSLDVPAQQRELTGRLDELPTPGLRLKESALETDTAWPRILSFPEHSTLERVLGGAVASRILLLDATQPDGFERNWQLQVRFGPERHIAYAVQWFAFAAAALIIFVLLSFKRDPLRNDSSS